MRPSRFLLLAALAALAATACSPQDGFDYAQSLLSGGGSLSGKVISAACPIAYSGSQRLDVPPAAQACIAQPVPQYKLSFQRQSGGAGQSAITDSEGHYSIGLPAGSYVITPAGSAMRSSLPSSAIICRNCNLRWTVAIKAGERKTLDIRLGAYYGRPGGYPPGVG